MTNTKKEKRFITLRRYLFTSIHSSNLYICSSRHYLTLLVHSDLMIPFAQIETIGIGRRRSFVQLFGIMTFAIG